MPRPSCPARPYLSRLLPRALVLALVPLLALTAPSAQAQPFGGEALLSLGPDLGGSGNRTAVFTGEIRPAREVWAGLQPIYSFSVTERGGILGGAGLMGDYRLGAVRITPNFSLVLFQDGSGGFDSRELIQFRTGIDLLVPLTPATSVGLGYFHVSNAGITRRSADMDVVRLSVVWRY